MSGNKLTRSTYLEGQLLAEGTEVTAEQYERLKKNPKLFAEPVDTTGPDANDTREYFQAIRKEADDSAYRKPTEVPEVGETDDRAAAGAKLARGTASKAAAPKATA